MKIGYHITKKNLDLSIIDAINNGANAMQFFISSPRVWAVSTLSLKEINAVKKIISENDIYLIVHGKYLYNFCRDDPAQLKVLESELRESAKLNLDVVIHQGKNMKELNITLMAALHIYIDNIKKVLHNTRDLNNKIILENSSHQGTELGYSLDELAYIYNQIKLEWPERIGICIDLCHIFVSGELDVRDGVSVKKFFKDFNKLIGYKNLTVIHYNDSSCKYDGHNDKHADILDGYIGNDKMGGGIDGYIMVCKYAKKYKIPLIMETPGVINYADQIKYITNMMS